ncbi:MAG: LEA type 2 family protein [Bacteroidales bacterium]|nr:LEA type 2 family protein [Bacteroidales bacterium]
MRKKIKSTYLLVIILFGLLSCNTKDVNIGDIKDVKLGGINSDNISLNITVPISNPNNFKIKIKKYNLTLKINNQTFKLIENNKNIVISRKFNGTISFPIKLKSEKLFNLKTVKTLYQLFSSKKAEIEIIGTIKIKVMCIPKKIQIKEKRTVNF